MIYYRNIYIIKYMILTVMLWLVWMRPRAGWLSGFVANLITWQPATIYFLFIFYFFHIFILAAFKNLFFRICILSYLIFLSVSVSFLLLLLAQLIINLKIGESKVFANVFIDFVRILDEPIINQRVQLNTWVQIRIQSIQWFNCWCTATTFDFFQCCIQQFSL